MVSPAVVWECGVRQHSGMIGSAGSVGSIPAIPTSSPASELTVRKAANAEQGQWPSITACEASGAKVYATAKRQNETERYGFLRREVPDSLFEKTTASWRHGKTGAPIHSAGGSERRVEHGKGALP